MDSPSPENDVIQTIYTTLTTLLTHHIPLTHHFKLKWSLLRTKLTHFQTLLSNFAPPLLTHSLSLSLLSSVTQTLASVTSLAVKCQNPNGIPDGKLKTQNDLDLVTAAFDQHIHDCEVLSRAAFDDPKRDLLTRVQIGSVESRILGMDEVLGFLNEDDKNVVGLMALGVVPVLVGLLDSGSVELREKTVSAIARVSCFDASKDVLFGEGLLLVNNLIRVIESGSVFAKEKACVVLKVLSFSRDNARAIGSRGGVSALLEICGYGTPNSQAMAAGVLRNLAAFDEVKETFVEENAFGVLVVLSGSGTGLARENSIGCLANLVVGDDMLKSLVVKEGVIDSLKSYWDLVGVDGGLEVGVELVRNLGMCRPIGEVLIGEGFVPRLVPLLDCGVLTLGIMAASAVYELGFSSKARREMGLLGCVSALVKLLDGKATEEREGAAKALSRVVLCNYNSKIFRKEERGIVGTVELLDPLITNLDKKWPIAVLATLVHSKKCKKQMVGAGACVYLHKLVEFDVQGAKNLLDSLGRTKLWGVFARP